MLTSSRMIACCICREPEKSIFYKNVAGHDLSRCRDCGLIHLNKSTANPDSFLEDATGPEKSEGLEYWGYPEYFVKHRPVFEMFFEQRYERINRELKSSGPWLDVGCGYGLWQEYLIQKKVEVLGIEIERRAYLHAQHSGLNVQHVSIEDFSTTMKFSSITMCDVLEHVEDPLMVLKKCHDLLGPEGLLYVQVPNVIGVKYPFGDSLGLPHHIWQFDPSTMIALAEKAGFKVESYWTGIQGVIRHYENGSPKMITRMLWTLAQLLKRGNRLQILLRK